MQLTRAVVVGIDEAGRGPVIGPMVIACVAFRPETLNSLGQLGVRDSKQLDRRRREQLFESIMGLAEAVVIIKVPPTLIDMVNLNELEAGEVAYSIRRLMQLGFEIQRVYIDAVGPTEKFRERVAHKAGIEPGKLVVEAKADAKHLVVGAASIVAKVVRDREIDILRRLYGVKGSGYPTDAETLRWIEEAYRRNPREPPPFIRRTWSTLRRIAPLWYMDKSKASTAGIEGGQRSLLEFIGKGRKR